ncbi:MAG: hypothetical protein EXR71_03440 [Myxococcales bacterium]|nr:hypothetical protein [Myxococcales bacterium]
MPEARRYVDPALWPEAAVFPDPTLLRALSHFDGLVHIPWTTHTDEAAASQWSEPAAVPELAAEAGVWLERRDGRWLLVRYAAGWGSEVTGPAELLRDMREAARDRDGTAFLASVKAGERTCKDRECRSIAEAVSKGEAPAMVDVIDMPEVKPGSLQVTEDDGEVVVRWLRETRFLGQEGVTELRFAKEDGRWVVTTADGSNFADIDEEMDTWTENHGEMLWRAEVAAYVEVRSLTPFCEEWYWGTCLTKVLPTEVRNVGTQSVKSVKVSKVRARRYMGQTSQTLWGIGRNLQPGKASSNPSSASPPVRRLRTGDVSETWEFYRVEWIEFEDGERLSYSARDYREAASGTLVFSDVRAARERGGLSTDGYRGLVRERTEAGYPDTPANPPVEGEGDAGMVAAPLADAASSGARGVPLRAADAAARATALANCAALRLRRPRRGRSAQRRAQRFGRRQRKSQ